MNHFPLKIIVESEKDRLLSIARLEKKHQKVQPPLPKCIMDWLAHYLRAEHPFPSFIPLDHLQPFGQKVISALCAIPIGQTATYQEIAQKVGVPKGARAVGQICAKKPYPLFIPCHRVVSSSGLGGFRFGLEMNKKLLDFEKQLA